MTGLQVWDIPMPPKLDECIMHPSTVSPEARLRTIDFSTITGLTFFYWLQSVCAIHAHTRAAPCAGASLQHLSVGLRGMFTWLYFPISPGDEVTSLRIEMRDQSEGFQDGEIRFLVCSSHLHCL